MKIKLEQIKGTLRERVDKAISELEQKDCKVIAFFLFEAKCHDYAWRSRGKYISIRYVAPYHYREQYDAVQVFLKKVKK
jgi:putative lipoic acid-binding regulatory protein